MAVNTVIITLEASHRFYLSLLQPQIQRNYFSDSLVQFSRQNLAAVKVKKVDSNMTLSEKLHNIVDKCNEAEKCCNAEPTFCKTTSCFESTKKRPNNISKLNEVLKLVSPTSIEAERDFFVAGEKSLLQKCYRKSYIRNQHVPRPIKLRGRLNDKRINKRILCLLRPHFVTEKVEVTV